MQWLLAQFFFVLVCICYVRAAWPSADSSNIKLLGLFFDPPNSSTLETTQESVHSHAMFNAALILAQRLNLTVQGQFIGSQTVQTGGNPFNTLSGVCRTVTTHNIVGIVGPSLSTEVHTITPLSTAIGIPIISYAATDPALSNKNAYRSFYRTVPSDKTTASAILKLFLQYNWTSSIIIYQNDAFGTGGADAISDEFDKHKIVVSETLVFDIVTLTFRGDLKTILTSSASRIVILWAVDIYTTSILQSALDSGVLGTQFLWIIATNVPLNKFNQTFHSQLIGMITIEPVVGSAVNAVVNSTLLNIAYGIWKEYEPETFPGPTKVNDYALFAFDATWALIQALSQLCSLDAKNASSCLSFINSSFCFDYRFVNVDSLLRLLDSTEFLGVSGLIKFSNSTTDRISGVYYVARNVQPSVNGIDYAPILGYSNSNNWSPVTQTSVMIWPGNTLTHFTGVSQLSGVTLRIGVYETAPFVMLQTIVDASGKNITKVTGYMADLIDHLQSKMGFTAQIMVAPLEQTYEELVRTVADNVYDIVVSDMTVLSYRREIIDFSNSIFDNSIRIVIRRSTSESIDLFAYLRPFSLRLWLTLLVALFYSGILFFVLERQNNEALQERSIIAAITMSVWYAFGTVTGYGIEFQAQTAGGRVLCMGLYIVSIILVATYTANLASELTLSRSQNIISGIDDIKAGMIPFSRIGILVGSSLEAYYLREVSRGNRNYYPLTSSAEIYSFLLENKIDAAFDDAGIVEYATNTLYCNLIPIGSDFFPSSYGVVMRKQWLYAQELDIAILSLREAGVFDALKRKWFSARTCPELSVRDTSISIKIEAVAGLFLTFAVISILAVTVFLWLKRRAIKDYFKSIRYRKNSSPQQIDGGDHHPHLDNQKSPQTFQRASDSFPMTRL